MKAVWILSVFAAASAACNRGEPAQRAQPLPKTEAPAKRELTQVERHGAELYARMCAVCHGAAGEGYKADQAPAIGLPDFLGSATDQFLHLAIANGRKGSTMSAWGKQHGGPLAAPDVVALIAYMRSWSARPRLALDERPIRGDAARGERLFERECVRCHGARGQDGPNVRLGDRQLLASASNGFLRQAIRHGRPPTTMPAYATALGDQGIEDAIAFLRSIHARAPAAEPPAARRPPPIPLGPVPLHPKGPQPVGFKAHPETTKVDVVHAQLRRRARMALLDARAPSDYTNEHIAGAVSVPFYDPSPYLAALPKDAWLVCYCACPHAESRTLTQKLLDAGFTKVTVLDEGLSVWKARNYPVRAGVEP